MRHAIGISIMAIVLTLAGCGPILARNLSLAGGLTLAGEALNYSVEATYPLLLEPTVNLKVLWEPERAEAAGAVSTPVSTFTEPLADWLRWTPAPWVSDLTRKVEVGAAFWQTQDQFPVRGGLFWQITALESGF